MRQSILFCMLALPVLAFCQPIEGPYVVLEAEQGAVLKDPHVVLRGDGLADIFYVQNSGDLDEVRLVSFSLVSQEVVSGPEVLFQEEGWVQDIKDVENQSDGSWAVVLHSRQGCCLSVARMVNRNDMAINVFQLDHGDGTVEYPYWHEKEIVSDRAGGGWVAGWIHGSTSWIYYEPAFTPLYAFFGDSVYEGMIQVYCDSFLYGPTATRMISTSADTILVLLSQVENFAEWMEGSILGIVGRTQDPYPYQLTGVELTCTWSNLDFQRTHGDRLLIFSGLDDPYYPEYPHPRIVEVDTTGNCVELCTLPFDRDPDAIAWHPDYGFAAMLVHPARIMLARIDTNGVEVQPLGIFWEPAGGSRVAEANLAISDSGKVVVLWNELDETDAAVMKIGAVGWDTFLGLEEQRVKPMPEKISLSAYPNPFNLMATITFELPRAQEVSVVIYDVLGREVRELAQGIQTAGKHELRFDATGLSSGIYFVRLKAGAFAVAKKVLLLK